MRQTKWRAQKNTAKPMSISVYSYILLYPAYQAAWVKLMIQYKRPFFQMQLWDTVHYISCVHILLQSNRGLPWVVQMVQDKVSAKIRVIRTHFDSLPYEDLWNSCQMESLSWNPYHMDIHATRPWKLLREEQMVQGRCLWKYNLRTHATSWQ